MGDGETKGGGDRGPEESAAAVGERLGKGMGRLWRNVRRSTRGFPGRPHEAGQGSRADRAEAMVSGLEQSVNQAAGLAALQARRLLARAREQMEDIRAEAEAKRRASAEGSDDPTAAESDAPGEETS